MPSFVAMACRGLDGGLTNRETHNARTWHFLVVARALRHFDAKTTTSFEIIQQRELDIHSKCFMSVLETMQK